MELANVIIGILCIILIATLFYLFLKSQKKNLKYYSDEIYQLKIILGKTELKSEQIIKDIDVLNKLIIFQNEANVNQLKVLIENNSKQLNEEMTKILSTIQEPWPEDLFNRR
jgi:uncharacterized protein HemX